MHERIQEIRCEMRSSARQPALTVMADNPHLEALAVGLLISPDTLALIWGLTARLLLIGLLQNLTLLKSPA